MTTETKTTPQAIAPVGDAEAIESLGRAVV
jgi:hypothetical protein